MAGVGKDIKYVSGHVAEMNEEALHIKMTNKINEHQSRSNCSYKFSTTKQDHGFKSSFTDFISKKGIYNVYLLILETIFYTIQPVIKELIRDAYLMHNCHKYINHGSMPGQLDQGCDVNKQHFLDLGLHAGQRDNVQ